LDETIGGSLYKALCYLILLLK